MINKFTISLTIVFSLLLLLGISQVHAEKLQKSFDVRSGGTLYLKSDSGSIEIESHDRDVVEILVEKKGADADKFEVEFSKHGNDVTVEGDRTGGYGSFHANVHFSVKVPKNYNVKLKTGGGSIELSDLKGTVEAKTSGGSISLGRIEGEVDVSTSGGSIRVEEVMGNIDAHTSGGSITATISKQPTQDCELSTSGGGITVYLAADISVDLDASTSGGRVRSDFAVQGSVKKNRIKGTINGGGPNLDLSTSGGSVRVESI